MWYRDFIWAYFSMYNAKQHGGSKKQMFCFVCGGDSETLVLGM
jgi:hypothetical protein